MMFLLFFIFITPIHLAWPMGKFIDTHMHLIPAPPGGPSSAQSARGPRMRGRSGPGGASGEGKNFDQSAQYLVGQMDQLGIGKALIMPPPQGPGQMGAYNASELLQAIQKYPGRLYLAGGGGELNPLIYSVAADQVNESHKIHFKKVAQNLIDSGIHAFGEMTALHFALGPGHPFKQAPADHPLFLLLSDIAAESNIPIDLHMEVVKQDRPLPTPLKMRSELNPSIVPATIPGLKKLLAHNRKAKIVWQHAGWDSTGEMTIQLLEELLLQNSNLFFGLKFVQSHYEPFRQGNALADSKLILDKNWSTFIQKYPHRFVVGADEFPVPESGGRRRGPPSFKDTWTIVLQLPSAVIQKVAVDNPREIYGL